MPLPDWFWNEEDEPSGPKKEPLWPMDLRWRKDQLDSMNFANAYGEVGSTDKITGITVKGYKADMTILKKRRPKTNAPT